MSTIGLWLWKENTHGRWNIAEEWLTRSGVRWSASWRASGSG